MRILLQSFDLSFGPLTGADRTSRLARFLLNRGHDVRVLCATAAQGADGIEPERIVCTGWQERDARSSSWSRFLGSSPIKPDPEYRWRKPALKAASALFQTWQPDVVYAVCPPHSTAMIAAEIARTASIPYIVECRDRWFTGPASPQSKRRKSWDRQKEHEFLTRASGIVTPSPLWAQSYARRFGAEKVAVAMDGFDPEEYPLHAPVAHGGERRILHLLWTGSLDPGQRDPRTLFKGIAALGLGASDVRLSVIGDDPEPMMEVAREEGVEGQIDLFPPESRADTIQRQYQADALVLPLPNDEQAGGRVPETLFDYIGTRRPVIASGYSKGTAAEVIRKRNLGVFTNEPKVIANMMARLMAKKRAVGVVPFLPETMRDNATAAAQFAGLEPLLYDVTGAVPLSLAAE